MESAKFLCMEESKELARAVLVGSEERCPRKGNGAYSLSDIQLQGVPTCSLPRPQAMNNLTQIT